jgi:hypothetical protein
VLYWNNGINILTTVNLKWKSTFLIKSGLMFFVWHNFNFHKYLQIASFCRGVAVFVPQLMSLWGSRKRYVPFIPASKYFRLFWQVFGFVSLLLCPCLPMETRLTMRQRVCVCVCVCDHAVSSQHTVESRLLTTIDAN